MPALSRSHSADLPVIIQPLDEQQHEQVRRATVDCLQQAGQMFQFSLMDGPLLEV